MTALTVLRWTAFFGAAVPLLICAAQAVRRRNPPPDGWLIAAAFFVSFLADAIGYALASEGIRTLWLGYVYAPLQFGILVLAVAQGQNLRKGLLWGIGGLAVYSATVGRYTGWRVPETILRVCGGAVIGVLILAVGHLARYRLPVLLYCVVEIPFLILRGSTTPALGGVHEVGIVGYHVTRTVAYALMTWALARPVLEVARGGAGVRAQGAAHPDQRGARLRAGGMDRH